MASRGQAETDKLRKNLEEQLERLVQQLKDVEECREDMEEEEYHELKAETLEQLSDFKKTLKRMASGNMSLVNEINRMQLAIQAAISQAFKTPEVIKMFARKEPGQLRNRLSEIQRDVKTGHMNQGVGLGQQVEILTALRKLGEELTSEEQTILDRHSSESLKQFQQVSSQQASGEKINKLTKKS